MLTLYYSFMRLLVSTTFLYLIFSTSACLLFIRLKIFVVCFFTLTSLFLIRLFLFMTVSSNFLIVFMFEVLVLFSVIYPVFLHFI
jgi:hypothetical protein